MSGDISQDLAEALVRGCFPPELERGMRGLLEGQNGSAVGGRLAAMLFDGTTLRVLGERVVQRAAVQMEDPLPSSSAYCYYWDKRYLEPLASAVHTLAFGAGSVLRKAAELPYRWNMEEVFFVQRQLDQILTPRYAMEITGLGTPFLVHRDETTEQRERAARWKRAASAAYRRARAEETALAKKKPKPAKRRGCFLDDEEAERMPRDRGLWWLSDPKRNAMFGCLYAITENFRLWPSLVHQLTGKRAQSQ